jgi:hypothetical protein
LKTWLSILPILVLALVAIGCGSDEGAQTAEAVDSHAGHDHAAGEGHDQADQAHGAAAAGSMSGEVVETMDSGGYTYVHVDCGDETIWAAAPQREVAVGSEVTIATVMPMKDFHSDKLDRTFDVVYFVNDFGDGAAAGHGAGMMGGMDGMSGTDGSHPDPKPAADVDLEGIERAAGGKTVAEVYAQSAELAGSEVTVRGKVVKYNSNIMGKNWLHLRDGSGEAGSNDLTITTQGFAKVGDLVTVTGKLATDRDFGAGYSYDVIVEDATVVKQ